MRCRLSVSWPFRFTHDTVYIYKTRTTRVRIKRRCGRLTFRRPLLPIRVLFCAVWFSVSFRRKWPFISLLLIFVIVAIYDGVGYGSSGIGKLGRAQCLPMFESAGQCGASYYLARQSLFSGDLGVFALLRIFKYMICAAV